MKLYNRSHFAVRHAASKNETRYNLYGIHFREDGSVEATDGHMAARATSPTPNVEEFPDVGIEATEESLKPFILPLSAADEISKSIPKRQRMSVLEHAALDVVGTNASGSSGITRFVTTDLETKRPTESHKIDGEFPNVDAVIPAMEGKPAFVLDAKLVERACKIAREFCGGAKRPSVKMQFYPGKKGTDAVGILVEDPDAGELRLVVMPMRI